jgi:hypothetical protein
MIIPLVGNFIAFVPPMLVVLVQKPDQWIWVLGALFLMQTFVMNFVGPRIMSQAIGIHPLYVMAAMLIGGQIGGFWGALFGIPIAGVMNLVGRPIMRRIRHQSPLFQEASASELTTRAFVTGPLRDSLVEEDQKSRAVEGATSTTRTPGTPGTEGGISTLPPGMLFDDEEEAGYRPRDTLSGKAWNLAWNALARAYSWVGTRARPGSTRQS